MTQTDQNLLHKMPAAGLSMAGIFVLTLWQPNTLRLPWEEALPTIAVTLGLAALFIALLRPLAGSWRRASLIGAIWTAWCAYGPVAVSMVFDAPGWRWAALAVLALFAWDVSRKVPRGEADLAKVTRLTNITLLPYALMLVTIALYNVARFESTRPEPATVFKLPQARADANSPDVWHIIMDRYGDAETLRNVYGHDNRPFLDALRARGFTVSDTAFSNYQRTGHSVTSTLNASYLDPLGQAGANPADWVPLYRALADNAALRFFNAAGYRTIYSGSWWNPTRRSDSADTNINYRALPELAQLMLDQTAIGRAMAALRLPYGDTRREQCERTRREFAQLRAVAQSGDRKYVFAHFLVPHPPYVLNADGTCRDLAVAKAATRAQNYAGQVEYANRELLALIDRILAGPRKATIVLHADEGPWPAPYFDNEHEQGQDPVAVDWPNLDRAALREKLGILMAIRHADGAPAPALQSPVNIYPVVLNHSFGGKIPLQPDRHFVFNREDALYTFTDVGGKIR